MTREKKKSKATPELAPLSRRDWVIRGMVLAFFTWHFATVFWWLIPAQGYPSDRKSVRPAPWMENVENAVFKWKRDMVAAKKPWLYWFENYTFVTATWQRWWLFAPNPTDVDDWITVYAVTGWKDPDESEPSFSKEPMPAWGNRRKPIYDPKPIYQSYPGNLFASVHGTVWFYRHDSKMVENFSSGKWNDPLASFAQWSGNQYRMRNGKLPLGVHIVQHRGRIPAGLSGKTLATTDVHDRVLWYLHY